METRTWLESYVSGRDVFVSARLASTHSYSHSREGTMLFWSHSCVMFHPSPSFTMLTSHISETLLFPTCPDVQESQTLAFGQKSYFRSLFPLCFNPVREQTGAEGITVKGLRETWGHITDKLKSSWLHCVLVQIDLREKKKTLSILIGTLLLPLLINAIIHSANHVAGAQCMELCIDRSRAHQNGE